MYKYLFIMIISYIIDLEIEIESDNPPVFKEKLKKILVDDNEINEDHKDDIQGFSKLINQMDDLDPESQYYVKEQALLFEGQQNESHSQKFRLAKQQLDFYRRQIQFKKIYYIHIPVQFIFLLCIQYMLWDLISYFSDSGIIYLQLQIISFIVITAGQIYIQAMNIQNSDELALYESTKLNKHDEKLFVKLMEESEEFGDEQILDNFIFQFSKVSIPEEVHKVAHF